MLVYTNTIKSISLDGESFPLFVVSRDGQEIASSSSPVVWKQILASFPSYFRPRITDQLCLQGTFSSHIAISGLHGNRGPAERRLHRVGGLLEHRMHAV